MTQISAPNPVQAEACDRRSLLRRIGLAAAAGGAVAVAGPLTRSDSAHAADGAPLILGQSNVASTFTEITGLSLDKSGLWVIGGSASGWGETAAVSGDSQTLTGLSGTSKSGKGVRARSDSNYGLDAESNTGVGAYIMSWEDHGIFAYSNSADTSKVGVIGICDSGTGVHGSSFNNVGVRGDGGWIGVLGSAEVGNAVATGVKGTADAGTGVLGTATSGHAITGVATASGGTAVTATAGPGAVALNVTGVAKFSRSGSVTIAAGHSSVVVSKVAVGAASLVLANLQQAAAGNAISSAVPNASAATITITLLKPAATNTKIAWFVVN